MYIFTHHWHWLMKSLRDDVIQDFATHCVRAPSCLDLFSSNALLTVHYHAYYMAAQLKKSFDKNMNLKIFY